MITHDIKDYISGDSLTLNFSVCDDAGAALDLTGATVKWGLSAFKSSIGAIVLEKTVGSGITITDAVAGTLAVRILPSDIPVGVYKYELQVETSAGDSYTVAQGLIHAVAAIYAD